LAQDYGPYDEGPGYGPSENVIVIGPRYRPHWPPTLDPARPLPTKLSEQVRYDDLDLTTRGGAHELRARIRDAASDVCGRLADRYFYKMSTSPSCYRKAVETGMNRASEAIYEARYYGYGY
jgi:UrcA family protein